MASHRKPRPAGTHGAGISTPALATVALTSVALLSQTAEAAPATEHGRPTLEEIEKKIDDLYRRAESATEKEQDKGRETAGRQRGRADVPREEVTRRAGRLSKPRGELDVLPASAQDYFDPSRVMDRLASRVKSAVERQEAARSLRAPGANRTTDTAPSPATAPAPARRRAMAEVQPQAPAEAARQAPGALGGAPTGSGTRTDSPADPRTESPADPRTAKAAVQKKLAIARVLLSQLTAQERPRPAAGQEGGRQKAVAVGRAAGSSGVTRAEKAVAFARAQIGKPCLWGASGPGSYDCSGLTQAAWKSAGVSLPRSAHDQAGAGSTVALADARPGDLIFFHDGIRHVGLCTGDGMMIHAPGPGTYVREESVYHGGESTIHSVVRPA